MAPQQETWVVTGASRGLGLEHVKQYLQQGFIVVAAARAPSKSEALTKLHKEYQDKLVLVSLDTGDSTSVKAGFHVLAHAHRLCMQQVLTSFPNLQAAAQQISQQFPDGIGELAASRWCAVYSADQDYAG